MMDDINKTLTPADIGTVVALESGAVYVAGRLAGYQRNHSEPTVAVWFEHGPQVRLMASTLHVVRWDVPSRVTVEGNGTQGAVPVVELGLG